MTKKEFENLKQWAESGHAKAMFDLAVCYGTGLGVVQDYAQSAHWYQKAADTNNTKADDLFRTQAMFNLAACYNEGRGVTKNHAQAIHWYQKAADSDNAKATDLVRAQAMFNLAAYYETDLGEHAQAFSWYQKAADLGIAQAMFNLAAYYAKGQYVAQDYTQVVYWCQKVIDSENNKDTDLLKAQTMFQLGLCYDNGSGVVQDHARAHSWYQKAADLDNINAMFNLALDYAKGQAVVQDHNQAFYWYQKIADSGDAEANGFLKAQAMYNLGLFYDRGLGVAQNNVQAVYYYQKSADLGITESMLNLGVCYAEGQGVAQNHAQAIYWYQKAADLGNRDAMFNLAAYFYLGLGSKKNTKQAIVWFKKAADEGKHQKALLFLMNEGNGLPKAAVNWAKNLFLERYFPVFAHFKTLTIDLDAKAATSCCTRFETLMHTIVEIENDHLFKNVDNGLSHYTKQNVLDALLGGRATHTGKQAVTALRQYMTAYLNDPTEGLYVFDESCFEGTPELEGFDVELIHNRFRDFKADGDDADHIPAQMFSLSLSKDKDSLDLWRAYTVTDGRANGVAVHIPAQTLASFTTGFSQGLTTPHIRSNGKDDLMQGGGDSQANFLLYEVRYGKEPVQDLWRQLQKPLKYALQAIKQVDDKAAQRPLFDCIVLALMRLTYLYKHDAYASEQEVRAIHIAEINEASVKTDERAPARLYVNSPALLFQDLGGEITLGPQMSPDEQAVLLWETRKRLIDLGLDKKVKVKTSKIPFR